MRTILTFLTIALTTIAFGQINQKKNLTDFLPNGYVIVEKMYGDLNKDSVKDCILTIKGTDKNQIVTDEYRGKLDRNRRGIIVLFNKKGYYELAVKNYNCFSSENEDGGIYFPPDLSVYIEKEKLYVSYGHGRYGSWKYTFRFQNSDFELIGYDSYSRSNIASDWVTFDQESCNFLTKRKQIRKIIKVNVEGKETYNEMWEKIAVNKLIKLSEIRDFDKLDIR